MSLFTIAQLAELSGVKPHTIRIWEKRYNLLEPERTDSNIRRYDDNQLRRLLNIVTLLNSGVKISKIAAFKEKEINDLIGKKIKEESTSDFTAETFISRLFTSGLTYNEAEFEKAFSSAVSNFGIRETYLKIIYPILLRTGFMWQDTSLNPCQEHFITNLIRRKLFTAIEAISFPVKPKRKFLLFLPEDEYHEIGLLFAYYLIRSAGHSVVYLGPNVPYENLKSTVAEYNPTDIQFFTVHRFPKNILQKLIKTMEHDFKKTNIIVSGDNSEMKGIKGGKNTRIVTTVEEFENLLK